MPAILTLAHSDGRGKGEGPYFAFLKIPSLTNSARIESSIMRSSASGGNEQLFRRVAGETRQQCNR